MAELGKQFLKKFVRQVCINIKNQDFQPTDKEDIITQLDKVKYAALKAKKQWLIEKEILTLERMVNSIGSSINSEIQQIRKNIEELQSKFSSDNYTVVDKNLLDEINEKIDIIIDSKISREKLSADIEQKFGSSSEKKKHLGLIEKKLAEIKKKHSILKKRRKDKRILEMERKIQALSSKVKNRIL